VFGLSASGAACAHLMLLAPRAEIAVFLVGPLALRSVASIPTFASLPLITYCLKEPVFGPGLRQPAITLCFTFLFEFLSAACSQ
jgi:hypothetical protein